jgi:hypothetical protein
MLLLVKSNKHPSSHRRLAKWMRNKNFTHLVENLLIPVRTVRYFSTHRMMSLTKSFRNADKVSMNIQVQRYRVF